MIELFLEIIMIVSLLCIFWTYAGYPLSLWLLSKLIEHRKILYDCTFFPVVTLMVMTYNEARTIEEKIKNSLAIEYPADKMEIMVVDSASTDGTPDIVKKFKNVRLMEQDSRKGKASAINFGIEHARGEIIIITDGNTMFNKEAVSRLVRHFADFNVGGVSGRFEAYASKNTSISRSVSFYWRLEDYLRKWEGYIDSPVTMAGPISAFRKDILGHVDETNLVEDFDIAVSSRRKGYRIIYDPSAIAYEPAPSVLKDLFIQKKRIVIGTLQTLMKHRTMFFNPKYGWYGTFILPSHKLFQMLSPFFFASLFISSLIFYITTRSTAASFILYLQLIGYVLSIISHIILNSRSNITIPCLSLTRYLAILQIIILSGWRDYIIGNYQVTWKKIESSREL